MADLSAHPEVQLFREYLQIPSVQPNVDYKPCIAFIQRQATELNLPIKIVYPSKPHIPVIILSWIGTKPDLPSIILNSHMDVVPVVESFWTHPPFAADIDEHGRIFARGAQDMKCVPIQQLAAIRTLKAQNFIPERTIHMTFIPDEEIGGIDGMQAFVKTEDFQRLNTGFVLDEGHGCDTNSFHVFYGERTSWRLRLIFTGTTGHGSLLLEKTAAEKFVSVTNKFMEFRGKELDKLKNNTNLTIGDVTTVNLTMINGGIQNNVIPPTISCVFDVRIAIDVDLEEFENMIRNWCTEAGDNIEIIFDEKNPSTIPSIIDDSNPYWKAFKTCLVDDLNLAIKPEICPARADITFIRQIGIQALGFSPINNTPILMHDHNEYLTIDVFLRGIEIYKKLIPKLASA